MRGQQLTYDVEVTPHGFFYIHRKGELLQRGRTTGTSGITSAQLMTLTMQKARDGIESLAGMRHE